ncbi:Sodium channel protein Nach [Dufourea novaeangliae]|uniref:Sodium channel protein Nach n=1 Tax=Dufourea novaeangliae TaxID=178035 RepID=A0A154NYE6_DUFNO|nr:Sodium channel protein Nach [Dufourea novaeangliae]
MVLKGSGRKMLARIRPNPWKNRKIRRFVTVLGVARHYCTNATLHGLGYVVDPELHAIERFLWLVVFIVHAVIAACVISHLTVKFQEAPTSIGIESMNHRISGVPFPSVTLCPNDRVDWDKALELEKRIFRNATDHRTLRTFRDFLVGLSVLSFGDFHRLDFLKHRRLDELTDMNVTDALLQVVPNCEQLLSDCWWRNSARDCCEIFELQKTEYGFCYSFNSQLAERIIRRKYHGYREKRPRRASSYGAWSGLRVTARFGNVTKPPESRETDGILFMLEDPRAWPNNGRVIPTNSLTTISFDCISGFATQSILNLDENRAPCRHSTEKLYTQDTCISLCKRNHAIKHCGCNPSFMFPAIQELTVIIDKLIASFILMQRKQKLKRIFSVKKKALKETRTDAVPYRAETQEREILGENSWAVAAEEREVLQDAPDDGQGHELFRLEVDQRSCEAEEEERVEQRQQREGLPVNEHCRVNSHKFGRRKGEQIENPTEAIATGTVVDVSRNQQDHFSRSGTLDADETIGPVPRATSDKRHDGGPLSRTSGGKTQTGMAMDAKLEAGCLSGRNDIEHHCRSACPSRFIPAAENRAPRPRGGIVRMCLTSKPFAGSSITERGSAFADQ